MQINVQSQVAVYNQLPEKLQQELDKISIPKKGHIIIEKFKKRTADALLPRPGTNVFTEVTGLPVGGTEFIRNKWIINYENKTHQVGFVKGFSAQGTPIFLNPGFVNGILHLSGINDEHQIIYRLLHLHPEFRENIIGSTGGFLFFKVDKDAEAQKEMKRLALVDSAIEYVKGLSDSLIMPIAEKVGVVGGSKIAVRVAMRKLAESAPERVLATHEMIEKTLMEEVLNYAFNLGIVSLDHTNMIVVWGENNEKITDFNINYSDQRKAFIDLMTTSKDGTVKVVYKKLKALVDLHATEDGLVKEMVEKKVNAPKAKAEDSKRENIEKIVSDL